MKFSPHPLVLSLALGAVALSACDEADDSAPQHRPSSSSTSVVTPTPEIPKQTKAPGVRALRIGVLLPQTGDLTHMGPGLDAGVKVALAQINRDGGVLGRRVKGAAADTGDGRPGVATASTKRLARQHVDAVIGGVSRDSSFEAWKVLAKRAQHAKGHHDRDIPLVSAATTAGDYDTWSDDDRAFRTVPTDALQTAVLARQVAAIAHSGSGPRTVAILTSDDAESQAVTDRLTDQLSSQGVQVVATIDADSTLTAYGPEVHQLIKTDADANLIVSADQSADMIDRLVRQKAGPSSTPLFLVSSNTADYGRPPVKLRQSLAGAVGVMPGAKPPAWFLDEVKRVNPRLRTPGLAAESYDATMLVALAAYQAGDTEPSKIATNIRDVSSHGVPCHTFQDCRVLIDQGSDINYEGVSGRVDLNTWGSPGTGTTTVMKYDADNLPAPSDYVEGIVR